METPRSFDCGHPEGDPDEAPHPYSSRRTYDTVSDLDPSLPTEAIDPAPCGVLQVSQVTGMPDGRVDTGAGSTAGVEHVGLIAAGGVAALGGVALRST